MRLPTNESGQIDFQSLIPLPQKPRAVTNYIES